MLTPIVKRNYKLYPKLEVPRQKQKSRNVRLSAPAVNDLSRIDEQKQKSCENQGPKFGLKNEEDKISEQIENLTLARPRYMATMPLLPPRANSILHKPCVPTTIAEDAELDLSPPRTNVADAAVQATAATFTKCSSLESPLAFPLRSEVSYSNFDAKSEEPSSRPLRANTVDVGVQVVAITSSKCNPHVFSARSEKIPHSNTKSQAPSPRPSRANMVDAAVQVVDVTAPQRKATQNRRAFTLKNESTHSKFVTNSQRAPSGMKGAFKTHDSISKCSRAGRTASALNKRATLWCCVSVRP
ncbi:unnamed protein product [Gongylonema pulchrum]|uniref:TPX2_importin domain-containing protein n=1 Tax=Gongylonema pulchrum TaxID=637853 RepID=A0A183DAB6_9BILA|nr:unnamed protein product [Gongylonema pulchrum]